MMRKANIFMACLCGASLLTRMTTSQTRADDVPGCPFEVPHLTGICAGAWNEVETDTYYCRTSDAELCCKYRKIKRFCDPGGDYIGMSIS
jgi:hypothetical protein